MLVALTGCGAKVVVDQDPSTVSGGTGGTGGTGAGAPTLHALLLATPEADAVCSYLAYPPPEPNTLYLVVANSPISCDDNAPVDPNACAVFGGKSVRWELCISLSSAEVAPGVINVTPDNSALEFCDTDGAMGTNSGAGSFVMSGVLTITQADASSVAFSLEGVQSLGDGSASTDGSSVAGRCP